MNIFSLNFKPELSFKTSRSSGSGGQNVNKVATKVELNFDVNASALLTDEQKVIVFEKLINRINKNGILQIVSQSERTQLMNKKQAVKRFYEIIENCLIEEKPRIPTKPSKAAKERRLKKKKMLSEKKGRRREGTKDDNSYK